MKLRKYRLEFLSVCNKSSISCHLAGKFGVGKILKEVVVILVEILMFLNKFYIINMVSFFDKKTPKFLHKSFAKR